MKSCSAELDCSVLQDNKNPNKQKSHRIREQIRVSGIDPILKIFAVILNIQMDCEGIRQKGNLAETRETEELHVSLELSVLKLA